MLAPSITEFSRALRHTGKRLLSASLLITVAKKWQNNANVTVRGLLLSLARRPLANLDRS